MNKQFTPVLLFAASLFALTASSENIDGNWYDTENSNSEMQSLAVTGGFTKPVKPTKPVAGGGAAAGPKPVAPPKPVGGHHGPAPVAPSKPAGHPSPTNPIHNPSPGTPGNHPGNSGHNHTPGVNPPSHPSGHPVAAKPPTPANPAKPPGHMAGGGHGFGPKPPSHPSGPPGPHGGNPHPPVGVIGHPAPKPPAGKPVPVGPGKPNSGSVASNTGSGSGSGGTVTGGGVPSATPVAFPTVKPNPVASPGPSGPKPPAPSPKPPPVASPAPSPPPKPNPPVHVDASPSPVPSPIHGTPPADPVPVKAKPGKNTGVNPVLPVKKDPPDKINIHNSPSHLSNPDTQENLREVEKLRNDFASQYPKMIEQTWALSKDFDGRYMNALTKRAEVLQTYFENPVFPFYYRNYWAHGFFAGYWYPVRPALNISKYFSYPLVLWVYANTPESDFYKNWQSLKNEQCPVEKFPFPRVYFPTDTLRDLTVEMSNLPCRGQNEFRRAITGLTDSLSEQINDRLSATLVLNDSDVVVTHYENVSNNALIVEGFVDRDNLHLGFKSLLSLKGTFKPLAFIPDSFEPTDEDLARLNPINDWIVDAGGDPFTAQQEPPPKN